MDVVRWVGLRRANTMIQTDRGCGVRQLRFLSSVFLVTIIVGSTSSYAATADAAETTAVTDESKTGAISTDATVTDTAVTGATITNATSIDVTLTAASMSGTILTNFFTGTTVYDDTSVTSVTSAEGSDYSDSTSTDQSSGYSDSTSMDQSSGYSDSTSTDQSSGYSDSTSMDQSSDYSDSTSTDQTSGYSDSTSTDQSSGYSDSTSTDQSSDYSDSTSTDQTSGYSDSTSMDQSSGYSDSTSTDQSSGYSDSTSTDQSLDYSDSTSTDQSSDYSDSTSTDQTSGYSDSTSMDQSSDYSDSTSTDQSSDYSDSTSTDQTSGYSDSTSMDQSSDYSDSPPTDSTDYRDTSPMDQSTYYSDTTPTDQSKDDSTTYRNTGYSDTTPTGQNTGYSDTIPTGQNTGYSDTTPTGQNTGYSDTTPTGQNTGYSDTTPTIIGQSADYSSTATSEETTAHFSETTTSQTATYSGSTPSTNSTDHSHTTADGNSTTHYTATTATTTGTNMVTSSPTRTPDGPILPPEPAYPVFYNISFSLYLNTTVNLDQPSDDLSLLTMEIESAIDSSFQVCPGYNGYTLAKISNTPSSSTVLRRRRTALALQDSNAEASYSVLIDMLVSVKEMKEKVISQVIPSLLESVFTKATVDVSRTESSMIHDLDMFIDGITESDVCAILIKANACVVCYHCGLDMTVLMPMCYIDCTYPHVCKVNSYDQPRQTGCVCDKNYLPVSGSCVHQDLIIGLSAGLGGALVLALIITVVVLVMRRKPSSSLSTSSAARPENTNKGLLSDDYLENTAFENAEYGHQIGGATNNGHASLEDATLRDVKQRQQPATATLRLVAAAAVEAVGAEDSQGVPSQTAVISSSVGATADRTSMTSSDFIDCGLPEADAVVTLEAEPSEKPRSFPITANIAYSGDSSHERGLNDLQLIFVNDRHIMNDEDFDPRISETIFDNNNETTINYNADNFDNFAPQLGHIDPTKNYKFERPTLKLSDSSAQSQNDEFKNFKPRLSHVDTTKNYEIKRPSLKPPAPSLSRGPPNTENYYF